MSQKRLVRALKIVGIGILLGAASFEAYVMMLDFG